MKLLKLVTITCVKSSMEPHYCAEYFLRQPGSVPLSLSGCDGGINVFEPYLKLQSAHQSFNYLTMRLLKLSVFRSIVAVLHRAHGNKSLKNRAQTSDQSGKDNTLVPLVVSMHCISAGLGWTG